MNWFENQIKNRLQNDEDDFSGAFCDLGSIVMGEAAAKAGLVTPTQKTHNAVQEILKFFGCDISPVPESIKEKDDYINYSIRTSGIMKRKVKLTGKWWRDASGPMLGALKNGDSVAFLPLSKGYAYLDYESGKRVFLNSKTAENIEDTAFCFYKPLPNRELTIVDLVKYIFSTITWSDWLFTILIVAITTLLGMFQPRISLLLFNYIIPSNSVNLLWAIAILMVSVAVATQILNLSQTLITTRLSMRMYNTIEPAVMMRVLNLPTGFFKKHAAGELNKKFSLILVICRSVLTVATGTILTSLFSFAYIVQIADITPALLAPSLIILGATLVMNLITTLVSIKVNRKSEIATAELAGMTYSMLTGIQKIKLTGSEKRMFARWASKYKVSSTIYFNPPFLMKYSNALTITISSIGLVIVYFIAIMSQISVGEYMAYNTAYGMVSASVLALGSLTTFFSGIKPQLDIVEPFLKAIPEIGENKAVLTSISGGIEINNLTFRYDEGGRNILDGIDIKIRPGQYVALVGKTGCGKSTLVRLLLGFERPNKGAVYYDGKDIEKLDLPSLRRMIGAVTQSGRLMNGDIFSNIVISAPHLTMDDAWEAARVAGIAEDIEAMPMGMNTVITEGSGGISGGQKQRLMIARAVAPKPKILIMDESTSALDNITQKHVADSLATLKCTRIVIAHRLSTIKDCDKIYVLENGKITDEGTFDELYSNKDGYFYELVSRQMIVDMDSETDAETDDR